MRKPVDLFYNPVLHFEKRLTAGDTRHAATTVEVPPTLVTMKLLKRLTAPLSVINLVQRRAARDLELHARGECVRGFEGALERAAVNRVKPLAPFRQLPRLKFSFLVETDAERAAPECLAQAVARCMPDEKESRHAIAPAG